VAIHIGDDKQKVCIGTGVAEHFIDFRKVDNVGEEVARLWDGIGLYGVFVTAIQTYPSSIYYFGNRVGGKVMCIYLPPAAPQHIDVGPSWMCSSKQSVQCTLVSSMADVDKTLNLAKRGLLK
jgi:D-arabinose 1-dehydrogenase-like Zn-dependent alcohol dehydrogenase